MLTASGALVVEKYEDLAGNIQPVNEELCDDFWLDLESAVAPEKVDHIQLTFVAGQLVDPLSCMKALALGSHGHHVAGDDETYMSSDMEEMVELFMKSASTQGGLDTMIESVGLDRLDGTYGLTSLDGLQQDDTRHLELRVDYEHFTSDSFLAACLRKSGCPAFIGEYVNGWVAWDDGEQCLRTGPSRAKSAAGWFDRKKAMRDQLRTDSNEGRLLNFMKRCELSTDHGKKPILIRREDIDQALCGNPFDVPFPRTIEPTELERYVLAFHDASGSVRFITLSDIVALGLPVHARNVTYYEYKDGLYPDITRAALVANGFLLATQGETSKFQYFRVRSRASVFESVIERIQGPTNPTFYTSMKGAPNRALSTARDIVKWSRQEMDSIYITDGRHPLDSEIVTTPDMLLFAVEKLDSHGWVRDPAEQRGKPAMKRKADIVDDDDWLVF